MLTIGSCFAEAIGDRLTTHKIHTLSNPFGVIFNPVSIHKVLIKSICNEVASDNSFLEHNGLHSHYDFHSSFSSPEKNALASKLAEAIGITHYFIKDATTIVITYGTAWVYERIDTGEIVANCHKLPAANFTKSLLSQKKFIESFDVFHKALKGINPSAQIVLTVSPVRHIKDTLELNAVSKSVLRVGCHSIAATYSDVEYFPSYEIMMDDLRDYRFYKSDMIHPTEEAEEYIWEIFVERYFDKMTREFFKQWKKIRSALSHQPFHPSAASHQLFLKETLHILNELKKFVNVDEEEQFIKSQLN
ncbi:MAG TPA: GSCFA domain-containing protein [Cyclobacteriaceae bacterium]|nr:GSCFA domain-containing protein [Cyclobacteriaceae bacterium]